ncbi:HNH endonuclease [Escherichia coli]|uniref:HNH endonuclease n=1 Tax=Escherichia coli TaxID=562 RepID=A0AAP3A916_ECOLX|nr:HNH endonuclease [Escherichia coli]
MCQGYLDTEKSVSYDHIVRVREGGDGNSDNVQLTHPYCNQSVKC